MSLDQMLRQAAHRVAEDVVVPEVDVSSVAARARRQRRLATAGVTALVAAIMVGGTLALDQREVTPAPIVPPRITGAGPVWYDDAGLHHGSQVEETAVSLQRPGRPDFLVPVGTLTLIQDGALYRSRLDPGGRVWHHPWGGRPRVVGHDAIAGPMGDPRGSTAAWFEGGELVVYDTARGRELSRSPQPMPDPTTGDHSGNSSGILDVTSHEVVWATGTGVQRLDLRTGDSAPLSENPDCFAASVCKPSDLDGSIIDAHGDTVVRHHARDGESGLRVDVGSVERRLAPAFEGRAILSPDGSYVLGVAGGTVKHGVVISDTRTGEEWIPDRPEFYAFISWAYGDLALIKADQGDRASALLACDASERTCVELPVEGAVRVLPTW